MIRHDWLLVVYDMQVGIVKQIENGQQITDKVVQVLAAARKAGIRVFFTRHMSLPRELMGVSQFRMAMAWQRVKLPQEVKPWFLRDAPGIPPDSGGESAAERSHLRQDRHVRVRRHAP